MNKTITLPGTDGEQGVFHKNKNAKLVSFTRSGGKGFICLCLPPNGTWHKVNDPKVDYSGWHGRMCCCCCYFFTLCKFGAFHWAPQVSRTLLSIQTEPSSAVIWTASIFLVPAMIGITVTIMFHNFWGFLTRFSYYDYYSLGVFHTIVSWCSFI